jgi:hypothetical protein
MGIAGYFRGCQAKFTLITVNFWGEMVNNLASYRLIVTLSNPPKN